MYATFGALFLSGAGWMLLRAGGANGDELGSARGTAATWLLKIHGAAAMAALVLLGTLLLGHVRSAWQARRNQGSGAGIFATCAVLALTGYGLYYAGGERLRGVVSEIHDWIGLAFPAVIAWHVWRGTRKRPTDPPELTSDDSK